MSHYRLNCKKFTQIAVTCTINTVPLLISQSKKKAKNIFIFTKFIILLA